MAAEKRVHEAVLKAIDKSILKSAHDCADGGLAVALAECCILGKVGADAALSADCAPSAALFAETQSRIIVSLAPDDLAALQQIARDCGVDCAVLGKTGGRGMRITVNDVEVVSVPVTQLESTWRNAIPNLMALSSS